MNDQESPSTSSVGLTTTEAGRRLAEFGPNATPEVAVHPLWLILGKFVAPIPCLLEAAIALQLILGEYIEASVIAVLLVFNAALALFHENRAHATVEALKSRLALYANVRRNGEWRTVPASEIVPGDVLKLSLGNVIAADVRLLTGGVLLDQSTITGESLPVEGAAGMETYAGVLVRRGEAIAVVTQTGARTKFGRTAELVRTAYVTSAQQRTIFRVVAYLAAINAVVASALIAYGWTIGLPGTEFIPLVLIAVLATVPVALPATFTLATAIGAQKLAGQGVLPTRLSAVDEAASMDLLCSDKTGTLTRNELAVVAIHAFPGFDNRQVAELGALASSEGGSDPVDQAVRRAARPDPSLRSRLLNFVPFDPASKMSQATIEDGTDKAIRIVKGAFATVAALAEPCPGSTEAATDLERQGFRVLAVARAQAGAMQLAGLLALSDPPRADAAMCIAQLRDLGVEVVIATGDAPLTAEVIARQVGISGTVRPPGPIAAGSTSLSDYAVFAGVLPEDKFNLVKALQAAGHTVGMCGDGANDAAALRQAQIGIAVSTATDVAKSAAGIVLTEPGLGGIVAAVREGRITFQRILTYTLRSIVNKVRQVLFLAIGLVMIRHAVLTPMMMVLSMITGDFLAMSATTDNVRPSRRPNTWRVGRLTLAGAILGLFDLIFCSAVLAFGKYQLGLSLGALQTLTLVTLVFNGQAVFYVVRERGRIWSSRPSGIVVLASLADILIVPTMANRGILMSSLPLGIIGGLFAAAVVLAFVLDLVKCEIFGRLQMA
ncbi:HAD-IC family P-type ATPase [Enhydrobacter aerosaccus]|uniref:HAD-IC family P-type ATPase n=1 Tax=Enhydrobacter aerosaccus TaxID=225324 RepID=UPI001C47E997|nr:HAD-IC family P-type ATPase [Enhydrobacter aerosaccus]